MPKSQQQHFVPKNAQQAAILKADMTRVALRNLVLAAETFIAESADDTFARTKALDELQKATSKARELIK